MSTNTRSNRERKSERLELRATPSSKETIQRASALSGLTPGDLAFDAARRILEEHEMMHLRGADRDAFLAAMLEASEPNKHLIAAFRRHRQLPG